MKKLSLERRRDELLTSLQPAHARYYQDGKHRGPSLHFHRRALEARRDHDFALFSDSVYAMLASWGMHRMDRGARMADFEIFLASLHVVWAKAAALEGKTPGMLNEIDWANLKGIFLEIRCMDSKASIVGNTKVMAHLLPELVPPIDRKYTLKFLFGWRQVPNDLEKEWLIVEQTLRDFFYPVCLDARFVTAWKEWSSDPARFVWDTSPIKTIDNVLIGLNAINAPPP